MVSKGMDLPGYFQMLARYNRIANERLYARVAHASACRRGLQSAL